MAFMTPDIQSTEYYSVETNIGTEIVPADLSPASFFRLGAYDEETSVFAVLCDVLNDYCEGKEIYEIDGRKGWIARLSAPGYMDCTDWSAHDSKFEAEQYLSDRYGNDDDETNEEYQNETRF